MFCVTVVKDMNVDDDYQSGIEFAGVFDSEEKANAAKLMVEKWLKEYGYDDGVVYIHPCELNRVGWYEIDQPI